VVEEDLINIVAALVDFDETKERNGKARRIVAVRKRPGQTAPEGAVVFDGMEHYAYEPSRLLCDDEGNVIENRNARLKFKTAEAKRAQADAGKALDRAQREQNEAGHFAVWSVDELARGRDPREVTWDTCIRESGLWKDADPEHDEDGHDEDELGGDATP